jgi:hypothetical protein
MPQYDHVCCWKATWPTILAEVERAMLAGAR